MYYIYISGQGYISPSTLYHPCAICATWPDFNVFFSFLFVNNESHCFCACLVAYNFSTKRLCNIFYFFLVLQNVNFFSICNKINSLATNLIEVKLWSEQIGCFLILRFFFRSGWVAKLSIYGNGKTGHCKIKYIILQPKTIF